MNWYYALHGKQAGPVPEDELARLASTLVINSTTLVWREGLTDWQPLVVALPRLVAGADAPQVGGVAVPAAQKDLYVQQMREGVASTAAGAMQYAGFWIRFVAKFIDGLVLKAVQFVITLLVGIASSSAGSDAITGVSIFLMLFGFALSFGYQTIMLGKYGATLGKMAVGLKVVRADGGNVTMGRAAARYFAELLSFMTLFVGYIMAAFDSEKRALHDHVCDTRVIKTR